MTSQIYPGQVWHHRHDGHAVRVTTVTDRTVGYSDQAGSHFVRRARFTSQYKREVPRG